VASMTTSQKKRAKFIFVPAHLNEPLEEWEVEYTEEQAVECLLDKVKVRKIYEMRERERETSTLNASHWWRLGVDKTTVVKKSRPPPPLQQAHFAKLKKGPKTPEQLAAQREAFLQHLPADQRASVPASLLETATGLGMVENVALLSNSAEHDFVGVNLYCDDEAGVYAAPTNVRASEIASCAGKQLDVKGDAFLARVRDDGNDVFERLDFVLSDVSSSARWVKQAEAQNRKKAEGESAASAMKRLGVTGAGANGGGACLAPSSTATATAKPKTDTRISELSASAAAREEGNAAFRKGQWKAAEKAYSRALELAEAKAGDDDDEKDAAADDAVAAANNRAAARLKLGDSAGALEDANRVLRLKPADVKARLRRAAAHDALEDGKRASEDFKFVLRLEPKNTQALQGMEKIKGKKPAL